MKRHHSSAMTLAALAALCCVPEAEAGRRDPGTPIIITPPPGHITVHVEVPMAASNLPFGRTHAPPPYPIPPQPPGKNKN